MIRVQARLVACVCALAVFQPVCVAAEQVDSVARHSYEWVDLSRCVKPKRKPPAVPPEDYEEYNFERRFLALEEGRPCIVMDSFIERLGGSSSPGMRVLSTRKFRLERGRWVRTPLIFGYFPYAIRRLQDRRVFYVEALLEEDIGDSMVVGHWNTDVYSLGTRTAPGQGPTDASVIDSVSGPKGDVLQGLAVVLSQRLRSGQLKPATQADAETERKRIRLLLSTAWETLPPAQRVPVDTDGLPR